MQCTLLAVRDIATDTHTICTASVHTSSHTAHCVTPRCTALLRTALYRDPLRPLSYTSPNLSPLPHNALNCSPCTALIVYVRMQWRTRTVTWTIPMMSPSWAAQWRTQKWRLLFTPSDTAVEKRHKVNHENSVCLCECAYISSIPQSLSSRALP